MNAPRTAACLGLTPLGGRVSLGAGDLRGGVAILGRGAEEVALLAFASMRLAGAAPVYLDLTGKAAELASGYARAAGAAYVMRDVLKVDGDEPEYHCQLISSAISTLFGLTGGQESVLDAAVAHIASEEGYASPSAIFDAASMVAGHKATDKQDVEGRLSGLQLLVASGEEGALAEVVREGGILSFGGYPPAVAEAASMMALARLLTLAKRGRSGFDSIFVSDAHRLFRPQRSSGHSRRLQGALLSCGVGKVLAAEHEGEVDERVTGGCAVRVVSSSVWNTDGGQKLLAGMFMLQDVGSGSSVPFFPSRFEPSRGSVVAGPPAREAPPELTLEIFEAISSNQLATKASVAAWLSVQYGRDAATEEVDRMVAEGLVIPMRPQEGPQGVVALRLTMLGEQEMKRLRENGQAGDPV